MNKFYGLLIMIKLSPWMVCFFLHTDGEPLWDELEYLAKIPVLNLDKSYRFSQVT